MTVPRSNASRDQNFVPTLMGVSSADGITPVPIEVDPTNGAILTTSDTSVAEAVAISDGTNSANVLKSDGTSAGNNALKVAGSYQELAGLTAGSLSADLVPSTDVSGYKWVSVHLTGTWVGTISFQGSNDNTNWLSVNLSLSTSIGTPLQSTSSTSNTMFDGPVSYRYLRMRMTSYTSGTATGTVELYSTPAALHTMGVSALQNGTWSVGANSATGSAVPANAFYMGGVAAGNLVGLQVNTGADGFSNSTNRLETASEGWTYNGTNWDKLRSATSAAGTTGTGVPAAGMLIFDGTNYIRPTTASSKADAESGGSVPIAANMVFNGTNWDRIRGNEAVSLLVSAARTTTQTSADLVNYSGKSALIVTLDMTVVGTGSVTVSIDRKDVASGKYVNMLTGAAITTNSTNVYKVGPDITAAANSIAQDYIGRTFRIVVTANNANSATYSVGYDLVRG